MRNQPKTTDQVLDEDAFRALYLSKCATKQQELLSFLSGYASVTGMKLFTNNKAILRHIDFLKR